MNDQFPLPLECLRLIINRFAIKHDLNTLATLLRVNKYVCLATLPYLYSNPFRFFIPAEIRDVHISMENEYPRLHSIIRNLLASVLDDECPGIVKAMYDVEQTPTQHWPIDYLSYLKHSQSQTGKSYSLLVNLSTHDPLTPRLKQYLDDHDLVSEYDTRAPTVYKNYDSHRDDPSGRKVSLNTIGHLSIDIHRELSWTLCSRVLEHIKSIVIPLSDVDRYLDMAHQMTSLQSVTFRMDEVADIHDWRGAEERMGAAVLEKLALAKTKRLEDLESAVEFVLLHTLLYPGTLAHVECPTHYANVSYAEQICPDSFYRCMAGAIKVRSCPTELTNKNWREFTVNVENTDLSQVQIMYVFGREMDWYFPLQARRFLHLCTALQAYMMTSLGPESFKWAVKKDTGTVLPPLEVVDIQAVKEPFGSELDDLGQGFGKTLKVFKATGYRLPPGTVLLENSVQTISIGRGWNMPLLRLLSVQMDSERLVLDLSLLSHCHELRRLVLSDSLSSYDVRNIQLYKPCQLPELSELFLSGTPGLAFHPNTLHSTMALKTLVLGSHNSFNQTILPSVHRALDTDLTDTVHSELEEEGLVLVRPLWTWDWHLAHLETLDLSRVLTDADFTLPPGAAQSAGSGGFLPPQELDNVPFEELVEIFFQLERLKKSMELPQETLQYGETNHVILNETQQIQRRMFDLRTRQEFYMFPHVMPQSDPQEIHDRQSRDLHDLVAASPVLKRVYDTLMAARVRYYEKEATHAAITAVFQMEHPDRLVVPSLKAMELNGRWVISDDMLGTVLGQVFVNVESLDLFGCEGFENRAWIRATAAMPFLKSATVNRVLDVRTAADFGLQMHGRRDSLGRALFETDTRKRLEYCFMGGSYSFAEGADVEL
ncbi:hypothetical protein BG000_000501 [Podila horticola]|nr:hypothetical protein BG000_000501 [Podila horticola]